MIERSVKNKLIGILIFCLGMLICSLSFAKSELSTGDWLPDSDPFAIGTFRQRGQIIDAKKAVLQDLVQYIQDSPRIKEIYNGDGQLLSLFDEELWPVALGAGYSSRLLFYVLKEYYDKNQSDGKVIYRTLESNPNIEYYAVPSSYILVYQDKSKPGFKGAGHYNVMTGGIKQIWRQSFSLSESGDPNTPSSLAIAKPYGQDIIHVLNWILKNNDMKGTIELKDWTYSYVITIKTKKLYK